MSFALYPDPPMRGLPVPAQATVFTPFAARSARVAEFDPPYPEVMFLRVAMFDGSSAPGLLVGVGTGTPVEVSADPQGVFRLPGDTGYVGDVSLKVISPNVIEVMVGLVSVDPAVGWRLGIRNTDAAERFFTWVVADSQADTLQPWIDPRPVEYSVEATIPVGGGPRHVAVDPVGQNAYVACYGSNLVTVIDLSGRSVVAEIPVGRHPFKVAVDRDRGAVYTADSEAFTISVIDTATRKVTTTILAIAPAGLAVDAARRTLYAGCVQRADVVGAVLMIDTGTQAQSHRVSLAHRPFDIAIDPTSHLVYATDFETTAVSVIDPATRAVTTIDVNKQTWGVAVDPVSGAAYVSCPNDNIVIMIHPDSRALTTIPVGTTPLGMAVDASAHAVYVANRGDNTVSAIDVRTGAQTSIPVGELPMGVAVDQLTGAAITANTGDAVSVIERRRP